MYICTYVDMCICMYVYMYIQQTKQIQLIEYSSIFYLQKMYAQLETKLKIKNLLLFHIGLNMFIRFYVNANAEL